MSLKGKCREVFLPLLLKNGEIKTLLGYEIIPEQREERNQLNS